MSVGQRVGQLRAAHGESLREAAIRTGVSHTTIARIEKGSVTGSFQYTLRQIAQGYGVEIGFLLSGQENSPMISPSVLFAENELGPLPREHAIAYLRLIRRALDANINPDTLEMALDLLILQQTKPRAARVG